jgi:hypothetical protein
MHRLNPQLVADRRRQEVIVGSSALTGQSILKNIGGRTAHRQPLTDMTNPSTHHETDQWLKARAANISTYINYAM